MPALKRALDKIRLPNAPGLLTFSAAIGLLSFIAYMGFAPGPDRAQRAFVRPEPRPPWFTPMHFQRVHALDRADPAAVALGMMRAFADDDYELVMAYAHHSWRQEQSPELMAERLEQLPSALAASPRNIRLLRTEQWRDERDVYLEFDSDMGPQQRRFILVPDTTLGGWAVVQLGPPDWRPFRQRDSSRARQDERADTPPDDDQTSDDQTDS